MATYNTFTSGAASTTKSDNGGIFWTQVRFTTFKALDSGYILATVGQLWPRRLP